MPDDDKMGMFAFRQERRKSHASDATIAKRKSRRSPMKDAISLKTLNNSSKKSVEPDEISDKTLVKDDQFDTSKNLNLLTPPKSIEMGRGENSIHL